jgi:hypothetical protein
MIMSIPSGFARRRSSIAPAGGASTRGDRQRAKFDARRRQRLAIVAGLAVLPCATDGHAINLNDPAAAAAGGISNYWDTVNTYPNVVSLFLVNSNSSECTGSLINSRTVLTAAHCLVAPNGGNFISDDGKAYTIRFNPDATIPSVHDRA